MRMKEVTNLALPKISIFNQIIDASLVLVLVLIHLLCCWS